MATGVYSVLRWGPALAGIVAAAALAGCNGASVQEEAGAVRETAPLVRVVAVRAADGEGAIRASGLVGFQRELTLAFKAPGVVDRILVDEGDRVRAGQRLAWIRPTEVAADARQSETAMETAERDLARAQALFDKGFVSQARLDNAKLAVERAKAARDASRFTEETAMIVAPSDGVVLRRLAEPAQVVGAGTPILLFGDQRSGQILRVAAASADAVRIAVGDPAQVRISNGPALKARVLRIAAKSDGATGAFDIELDLSGASGLRSGQVGEALISGSKSAPTSSPAIEAPTQALLDARADQGVVFVVDDKNIARRRAVVTEGVSGDVVRITNGLAPGERVVAAGAAYVRDGQAVTIAPAS